MLRQRQAFRKRSCGVALITVLWLVALLTMLATSVVTLSLSERRLATRNMEATRLDAIADSAIRLTLLRLIAPKPRSDPPRPGSAVPVETLGTTVEVLIERELGRVDLNTADEVLIFAMFAANGWTEEGAASLSARIADWKDSDDTPRDGGAERSQYVDARLPHTPRNGPFESAEELRQVLGAANVSEDLIGAFTVYTHTRSPADFAAAPAARRALEFADKRQLAGHKWITPAAEGTSSVDSGQQQTLIGEVVRIRACFEARSARCRVVIARLTGSRDQPLQIFVWK
jgi:general secretion pathway protein K